MLRKKDILNATQFLYASLKANPETKSPDKQSSSQVTIHAMSGFKCVTYVITRVHYMAINSCSIRKKERGSLGIYISLILNYTTQTVTMLAGKFLFVQHPES
jgi:hypothetical protein